MFYKLTTTLLNCFKKEIIANGNFCLRILNLAKYTYFFFYYYSCKNCFAVTVVLLLESSYLFLSSPKSCNVEGRIMTNSVILCFEFELIVLKKSKIIAKLLICNLKKARKGNWLIKIIKIVYEFLIQIFNLLKYIFAFHYSCKQLFLLHFRVTAGK